MIWIQDPDLDPCLTLYFLQHADRISACRISDRKLLLPLQENKKKFRKINPIKSSESITVKMDLSNWSDWNFHLSLLTR